MKNIVKTWFFSFVHLFFPRQCAVCGAILQEGEEGICMKCNMDMPRTNYHLRKDNPVERMFWGKIPLEYATSCFFYHKGSDFRRILHQLKYGGRKDLGEVMGRRIGYLKNIIMYSSRHFRCHRYSRRYCFRCPYEAYGNADP